MFSLMNVNLKVVVNFRFERRNTKITEKHKVHHVVIFVIRSVLRAPHL